MVLRPCVTGVVLKWNTMVVFPFIKAEASAEMPFTVKSAGWTVAGSTGSLTLTMKSVGAVPVITVPQAELVTWQGIELAVGVGVAVTVGVAVGVIVGVAVGVGVGPLPPQMIISLSVQTAVWPARASGTLITPVAVQLSVLGWYLPPLAVYEGDPNKLPPQIIISLSVQTAVCPSRADGALAVLVIVQLSVVGLYLAPVNKVLVPLHPPQTIISLSDHTAV